MAMYADCTQELNVCLGLPHGTISVTYAFGLQGLLCAMRKGLFERKMIILRNQILFHRKRRKHIFVFIEKVLSN